ncbi:TetR/AcrR family transcriptional regulator [Streptomyces hokutonensis]|uniref:TetR/AcrR family transcriptional regulator n=1 Tax=Streptomyces hokutonensis TaxID=1306990 RepID=UPI0009965C32|nr:TetR family transcriptional regulator [Streptomyces hokutonensis]
MTKSASSLNRKRTAARITQCAQSLAEERGIDGFTMDDVAECAGVSRRTLFNYAAGKLDAVLGAPPTPDPSRLVEFRAGGPTGRLSDDIKAVVAAVLDSKDASAEEAERVRRLIASDPRLHRAMQDKFANFATFLADALMEREGPDFDPLRARVAATVTLSLFDVALEAYVADPSTTLADHYLAAFDGAAALFH